MPRADDLYDLYDLYDHRGSISVKNTTIYYYCTKQTVVVQYRTSVPCKILGFLTTIPIILWRPITAEAWRGNPVIA